MKSKVEVGGRSNFGRERDNFRRYSNDRDVEVDKGRDRDRNYGRFRKRFIEWKSL